MRPKRIYEPNRNFRRKIIATSENEYKNNDLLDRLSYLYNKNDYVKPKNPNKINLHKSMQYMNPYDKYLLQEDQPTTTTPSPLIINKKLMDSFERKLLEDFSDKLESTQKDTIIKIQQFLSDFKNDVKDDLDSVKNLINTNNYSKPFDANPYNKILNELANEKKSLIGKYCPAEILRSIQWNETLTNSNVNYSCPGHSIGFVKRTCLDSSKWSSPSYIKCVNFEINRIMNFYNIQIANLSNMDHYSFYRNISIQLNEAIAQETYLQPLYSGDFEHLLIFLFSKLQLYRKSFHKYDDYLLDLFLIDSLFEERNSDAWAEIFMLNNISLNISLNLIKEFTFIQLNQDIIQNYSKSLPNIIVDTNLTGAPSILIKIKFNPFTSNDTKQIFGKFIHDIKNDTFFTNKIPIAKTEFQTYLNSDYYCVNYNYSFSEPYLNKSYNNIINSKLKCSIQFQEDISLVCPCITNQFNIIIPYKDLNLDENNKMSFFSGEFDQKLLYFIPFIALILSACTVLLIL